MIDAFFGLCLSIGLLFLRLHPASNWARKSPTNGIVSVCAAAIFACSNAFPVIVLWIPPTAEFVTSVPWELKSAVGCSLLAASLVYWLIFCYVVPNVGRHAGRELNVERAPFFHLENGYPTQQVCEIVTFDWVVKA